MNTINNHVLRSLRYTLDLNDQQMVEIFRLADPATPVDARAVTAMVIPIAACHHVAPAASTASIGR